MRTSSLVWGIALVGLGGLLLLDNMGLLPRGIDAWDIFWPTLLIAWGVSLLTHSNRAARWRGAAGGGQVESLRLPLEGARAARVHIAHGAGELKIDDQAGPGDLVSGSYSGGLEHRLTREGDTAVLDLRAPVGSIPMVLPFEGGSGYNWNLGLARELPLDLHLELGASRNRIDLRGLQVRNLRVQTGASATEIEFPASAGQTFARVETGVASVSLRIPQGVAARIRSNSGLAGVDIDINRFPRVEGGYRSPDYDTAANRLDLELETGVGAVNLR